MISIFEKYLMTSFPSSVQWDDARVFLAVARGGSLSAAAQTLGLGIATVSRRLERLEEALGLPLFSRHQSGYRLTDDGQALLERAELLEDAGKAFGESVRQQAQVDGCVRLATAENLANSLIIESLPQLLASHPQLRLEIGSGVQTVNLHRRDADLAVRMVKPEVGNVTIRRLGTLGMGLYGAPTYMAGRDDPASTDVEQDFLIGWPQSHAHLPAAQWVSKTLRGRPCRLETNTLTVQLASAVAGLGLTVLPHFLARKAGLVCLRPALGVDQPIWLVMHTDLAHSRRVRVVADHLIALFEANAALLAHAAADEGGF